MCLEESRRGPAPPLMVSGRREEEGRGQTKRERRGSGAGGQARPRLNLREMRGCGFPGGRKIKSAWAGD